MAAASVLVALVFASATPAAADEAPSAAEALTADLPADAGIQSRLAGLTAFADARDAATGGLAQPLGRADTETRAALSGLSGDMVRDSVTFESDVSMLDHVDALKSVDSSAIASIGAHIAEADRIAAAREFDAYLALPVAGDVQQATIAAFQKEYDQAIHHAAIGNYAQASRFAGRAWATVHGELVDDWTSSDGDGDVLPDDVEARIGTNAGVADTDSDGLTDAVELLTTFTDPSSAATYGVDDRMADVDHDGLSTQDELRLGSDPVEPDTDADGLKDGDEVGFGSDPLVADVDADHLSDLGELHVGTDPHDPDTDDDGILDGDEVYTTTATRTDLGLTVAVTGVGDVAASVSTEDLSDVILFDEMPGRIGPAVDVTTNQAFTAADVTFAFDPAQVPGGDLNGLSIGWYNEENGALETLPTAVDPTGSATATTSHFTTFVLFYVPNWQAVFDLWTPAGLGGGASQFVDVMLVLDSSGSMTSSDRYGLRRTAAKSFVDGLIEGDRAGVVDFDSYASLFQPLTPDFNAVKSAIDRVDSSGGTDIGAGVSLANGQLIAAGDPEHLKAEILLTDGEGSYRTALTQQAIDNDITIYTIGLGSAVDEALLQQIATATGGQYFQVANASDLPQVFDRVGEDLDEGADTDGDGLLDGDEVHGMPTGTGRFIYTNPYDADTDDDGLLDGDELTPEWATYAPVITHFRLASNPNVRDTDSDGLSDGEEADAGLQPLNQDIDRDGVVDGEEYARGWDYDNANPDGDRFSDSQELTNGTDPFTYDPSFADKVRALFSGALLGEVGYWLADQDMSARISIAYPRLGKPTLVVGVDQVDLCRIPLVVTCQELVQFRPMDVNQVEYVAGMVSLGLIPFVDLAVSVRDTIGSALQGQWGWAVVEVVGGALGFVVPAAGDIPGIVADVGKWINRAVDVVKKSDELVVFIAKAADETAAFRAPFIPIVKVVKRGAYNTLHGVGMADDDIRRLAKGGQRLDDVAAALSDDAVEVRSISQDMTSVKGWLDDGAPRGSWGREAEDALHEMTGGAPKRLEAVVTDPVTHRPTKFRIVDDFSLSPDGPVAHEAKTGDGKLTRGIRLQILKDQELLHRSKVAEYTWEFFPSARSNRMGPDPELLKALKDAGIKVRVWRP